MKIYGQNLRDILLQLPWQYKIVVAAGSFFLVFVVVYISKQLLAVGLKPPEIEALQISSSRAVGVFDPALAYDPQKNIVWMAYAADEPPQKAQQGVRLPSVRLARTSGKEDACKNWTQSFGSGFEARPDDLLAPDGQTVFKSGAWRVETPALVHDPDDPGKEWKLYAYRYFWPQDPGQALAIAQHYGTIVYKYASDPAGEWSPEQWLFSPAPDYPPPPYEQMILLHLNRLDPSLQDVVTYARPSVVYVDGALVMTLSAFTGGQTPDRVIMIISRDHGNSWVYAGAPLRQADVSAIGPYSKLAGATLLEDKGRVYLAAVLGDNALTGRGTFVFGFDDIGTGRLKRDAKTGAPVVLRQVPLNGKEPGPLGGGFAAYSAACPFGMLTAEQTRGAASFQIFKTYKLPVPK